MGPRRALALAAVVLACSGCAAAGLIRNRLPRPAITPNGVLFRYEAPAARQVNVAGQWNNWGGTQGGGRFDPGIDPMKGPDAAGIWSLMVPLSAGRYQYKFVVDQVRWEQDPSNPDKGNDSGIENSLIVVPTGTKYEEGAAAAAVAAPVAAPKKAEAPPAAGMIPFDFRYTGAAGSVFVVGSFNNWVAERNPMTKGKDGTWTARVHLLPGTYMYKLVVDGKWIEDPANSSSVDDGFGRKNSVLTVGAPGAADSASGR